MKLTYSDAPLICSCGCDAIGETDIEDGDGFYPCVALCGYCLMTRVANVVGPVYSLSVGVQA